MLEVSRRPVDHFGSRRLIAPEVRDRWVGIVAAGVMDPGWALSARRIWLSSGFGAASIEAGGSSSAGLGRESGDWRIARNTSARSYTWLYCSISVFLMSSASSRRPDWKAASAICHCFSMIPAAVLDRVFELLDAI